MNERIEGLWWKARIGYNNQQVDPEVLAKFAELIVQDCIDIISPYTVSMNRPGEEFLHPIQEIRKHFGVE